MFSKYRPSAPPADLRHTSVDRGLGTSSVDPYTITVNNIPTTAPSMGAGNTVSHDQTGPATTVVSAATLGAGASLQASAAANAKRQLSAEEVASLERGTFTLSEWLGLKPQPTATDNNNSGAASNNNSNNNASSTSVTTPASNNGLLRIYIEKFLKVELPVPAGGAPSAAAIAAFSTDGIAAVCLAAGRPDTAVVAQTWQSIISKFPTAFTAASLASDPAAAAATARLFAPEAFLADVEAIQREALLYVASISPASFVFTSTASSSTGDNNNNNVAITSRSTAELLAAAPEDLARAVKALVGIAISARNDAIDALVTPLVTNSAFFDEGNAVWRVLLNTFDSEKRQIFVNATSSTSSSSSSSTSVDPLADSPQLAAFDWVMSHDRPLPRVTAPVCLLFLLSAVRVSTAAAAAASTAGANTSATVGAAATDAGEGSLLLLDAKSRNGVQRMTTLSRLPLITDEIRAVFVETALDAMLGKATTNTDASSSSSKAGAADLRRLFATSSVAGDKKGTPAAAADPKKFVEALRAVGFAPNVLQAVDLLAVHSAQQRAAEAGRTMSVAGGADVGAADAATAAADTNKRNKKDGKTDDAAAPVTTPAATPAVATVVINTNLTKAQRAQMAPLLPYFVNSKGVAAAFQTLYRGLSGEGGQNAAGAGAGASSSEIFHLSINNDRLVSISKALGLGPNAAKISQLFNPADPSFATHWAANYKAYAEAILADPNVAGPFVGAIDRLLGGSATLNEGVVSHEAVKLLKEHVTSMVAAKSKDAERAEAVRRSLLAPGSIGRVVEALAAAGADVGALFAINDKLASKAVHPPAAAAATAAALSPAAISQLGDLVIARHPNWATAGVVPPTGAHFTADNILAIAAHAFVRLSFVPHTALALLKRNYRGRIGEVFVPDAEAVAAGEPQPRHQNLPVELGKVEHYDTHLYKRNDPQGWYQRMRDIHNRNISVKISLADLRTVSDDFAALSGTFGGAKASSSSSSSDADAAKKDGENDELLASSAYNTNSTAGQQPYFGTQHERRLRVLAGDRVGMDIIKLDADRYEDADDNEKHGIVKLQQLLSDAKKVELGKAYWPTVEVKVRNPSGQSRSMQSLIDYARNEAQSKELFEQYRDLKKGALFVSPMDLYLKDRTEAAAQSTGSARTSVTAEGYVVGVE